MSVSATQQCPRFRPVIILSARATRLCRCTFLPVRVSVIWSRLWRCYGMVRILSVTLSLWCRSMFRAVFWPSICAPSCPSSCRAVFLAVTVSASRSFSCRRRSCPPQCLRSCPLSGLFSCLPVSSGASRRARDGVLFSVVRNNVRDCAGCSRRLCGGVAAVLLRGRCGAWSRGGTGPAAGRRPPPRRPRQAYCPVIARLLRAIFTPILTGPIRRYSRPCCSRYSPPCHGGNPGVREGLRRLPVTTLLGRPSVPVAGSFLARAAGDWSRPGAGR